MPRERLTIVIPVLNEEAVLDRLADHLRAVLEGLDLSWEVLFVDDGSTDGSLAKLKDIHAADRRFSSISFSRNFGKEAAIAAGLRYARGDAVILMDADLQHPPNIIPRFIECWRQGYKIVFGQRQGRDDRFLRRLASRMFYASFRRVARTRLPAGVVDFLLLDRQAVDAINRLGEQTRFSKGLYAWIGFPSTTVPFTSGERESGASRWNTLKLAQFALDGFVSFTSLPLKVWSYFGALISLGALTYAAYFIVYTLLFDADLPGFPSLIVSIMFFAGVQLVSLGVIGEYLARIYEEVKGRPLYIVSQEIGIRGEKSPAQRKAEHGTLATSRKLRHYPPSRGAVSRRMGTRAAPVLRALHHARRVSDRTSNPLSLFISMGRTRISETRLFRLGHLPGIGHEGTARLFREMHPYCWVARCVGSNALDLRPQNPSRRDEGMSRSIVGA